MHGSVSPSFVEETTRTVQVVEEVLVLLATEEFHVSYFKVTPEVAGRESLSTMVVFWALDAIREPVDGGIFVDIIGMVGKELGSLGPKGRQSLGVVVERNGEAVCLVVVLHIAEHVVVYVAEEMNLRLDTPVPASVLERRVLVEHAAVPPAHLVVRHHVCVLYSLLLEGRGGCVEHVVVDP